MKFFYSLALAALLGIVATEAQAQLITWEPAVNMFQTDGDDTDESFVSTNGTLVEAVNGGSAIDSTVNGVVFVALPGSGIDATGAMIPTNSNGQVTTSPGGFITVNDSNSNDGAFQGGEFGGNTEVLELIHSGLWACNSVTLNNLVVGNTYEVQVMNNDARGNRDVAFIAGYGIGDASGPVGMLLLNSSPTDDSAPVFPDTNVGQSIIGTFTAASTSLTFEVFGTNSGDPANLTNGDSRGQINGLQLRDITDMMAPIKGDVNCDGIVNFLDIAPFIQALSAGSTDPKADVDCNGEVNFLDIAPFIALLSGGGTPTAP